MRIGRSDSLTGSQDARTHRVVRGEMPVEGCLRALPRASADLNYRFQFSEPPRLLVGGKLLLAYQAQMLSSRLCVSPPEFFQV